MKIKEILESDLSWEEKFSRAVLIYETQSLWLDEQTKDTIEKYYEKLKETLEAVRHLHCMYKLGYDPIKDQITDFNELRKGI